MKFEETILSEKLKKALKEYGFLETTPIQEKSIPNIIEGKDIIGQSQTGTGKTAAYSLPILNKMNQDLKKTQAIILCPTRELAVQVVGEIRRFAKYEEGIKALAIYGGESIEKQILALKGGVQIIVGTPGRIMDHMRRKTLKLKDVSMVVLDEADEMLNMGFEEDINTILSQVPEERQTILFSATMNARILGIAKKYLKEPYEIKIPAKELTVDRIEQYAIELKQAMKDEPLTRIIDFNNPKKCVVFCNTKRKVDELMECFRKKGYKAESLHGDVKQDQRERIMKRFKHGDYPILIATDVVARGIDVDDLELVVNYDVPQEEEYYVHRIGRTGRNGNQGKAYTFVVGRERQKLFQIEKYAKTRVFPAEIPNDEEMKEIKKAKLITKIQKIIDEQNGEENEILQDVYQELQQKNAEERVVKALLQLAVGKETIVNRLNTSLPKKKETNNGITVLRKNSKQKEKTNRNNLQQKEKRINNFNQKGKTAESDSKSKGKIMENDSRQKEAVIRSKRFFISLGRMDAIKPKDIVGSITSNTKISGNEIGRIDIMDKFSFVEISDKYEENILLAMNGKTIKGKEVRLELAKNR